jgi:hypothetical protein
MRYLPFFAALLLAACASTQRPAHVEQMSVEEIRAFLAVTLPDCAKPFVQMRDGKWVLYRTQYEWPNGQVNRYETCRPVWDQFTRDQQSARAQLFKLDPLPNCFDPQGAVKILADSGLTVHALEANLILLSKGYIVGSFECTLRLCEWADRNITGHPEFPEQCAKRRRDWEALDKESLAPLASRSPLE